MQLVKYEAARHALQEAKSIDEVKDIRDKVEALKSYARQRDDKDMEVWLSEIKLRADRRIGEISVDLDKLDRKESGLKKGSPNSGKTSKAATLKAAGISKSAAYRCEELSSLKEEEFEEVIKKATEKKRPISISSMLKTKKRKDFQDKTKAAADSVLGGIKVDEIIFGDFREASDFIPDNSVDLVFIDPPYDKESIPLYEASAEVAYRILKPGGHCLAYCGTYALPQIMNGMGAHLDYFWTNACIHDGGSLAQMGMIGLVVGWKPIVWYIKGKRIDTDVFVNDFISRPQEKKDHHDWQQAEEDAKYYIGKLCPDDGLVVDFFCGGGTTGAVAESMGRKWYMFDVDETAIEAAMVRIHKIRQS